MFFGFRKIANRQNARFIVKNRNKNAAFGFVSEILTKKPFFKKRKTPFIISLLLAKISGIIYNHICGGFK